MSRAVSLSNQLFGIVFGDLVNENVELGPVVQVFDRNAVVLIPTSATLHLHSSISPSHTTFAFGLYICTRTLQLHSHHILRFTFISVRSRHRPNGRLLRRV